MPRRGTTAAPAGSAPGAAHPGEPMSDEGKAGRRRGGRIVAPASPASAGNANPPPGADPAPPARFVYGPRPVGALIPPLTRPAFRRRAPAAAQLMADWAAIVGPELAAITTPRRLSGGTLTLACAGPVALELQHLGPTLIGRINAHLGTATVHRLAFVQVAPAAPSGTAAPPRRPDPATVARVESALADLPDGALRDALAALGRAAFAR